MHEDEDYNDCSDWDKLLWWLQCTKDDYSVMLTLVMMVRVIIGTENIATIKSLLMIFMITFVIVVIKSKQ